MAKIYVEDGTNAPQSIQFCHHVRTEKPHVFCVNPSFVAVRRRIKELAKGNCTQFTMGNYIISRRKANLWLQIRSVAKPRRTTSLPRSQMWQWVRSGAWRNSGGGPVRVKKLDWAGSRRQRRVYRYLPTVLKWLHLSSEANYSFIVGKPIRRRRDQRTWASNVQNDSNRTIIS